MSKSLLAALIIVGSLVLAGCGDDEPEADPGPSSTSEASSSDPTTTPTESTEPTEPEGQRVEVDGIAMTVPEGWKVVDKSDSTFVLEDKKVGTNSLSVASVANGGDDTLEDGRDFFITASAYSPPATVLDDLEVDGEPVWHLKATLGRTGYVEAFGAETSSYSVTMEFVFNELTGSDKTSGPLIDEVLDSVAFE